MTALRPANRVLRALCSAACATGLSVSGCSSVTPAAPVSHFSPSPARPAPFNGEYDATFYTPWVGPLHARVIAEPTPEGFKANTPPRVAWKLVGGFEGMLGPIFAPFVFPSGMILTWTSTLPHDGKAGEGSIGIGSLPSLRVATRLEAPDQPFEVVLKDGRAVGLITLAPAGPGPMPHADFAALAERAAAELPARFFDPDLGRSPQVRQFCADLRSAAPRSRDDAEFLFAVAMASRKSLRQYFPLLYPAPDPAGLPAHLAEHLSDARTWRSDSSLDGVAYLRFDAFTDAESIDAALADAISEDTTGLILDVRGCVGVEPASLVLASHLIAEPADGGLLFTASGRARAFTSLAHDLARSDVPPDYAVIDVCSEADAERLASEAERTGLVRARVVPLPQRFTGPVAVLTSRRTSSTAEWLVWVLKSSGRARVFGEPTAGRPVLSRECDIGQGWVLRLPAIDWWPLEKPDPAGKTGFSVAPDEPTSKDGAEKAARKWLSSTARAPSETVRR